MYCFLPKRQRNVYKKTQRRIPEDSASYIQVCVTFTPYIYFLLFAVNQPGLTINEITAQVMVFFTGGFETTSTTMSFCLYELAKNKDIQCRLRSEMDTKLCPHGGQITYEAVMEMKHLDRVVSGEVIALALKVGKEAIPVTGRGDPWNREL
jgi:hypothetical protein